MNFAARRQAVAGDGPRSCRGPITAFAQAIPATLFGLPTEADPLATARDHHLLAQPGTRMPPVASPTVTRTTKSGRGL
ncbi:hypothetical protein [Streptomyces nymphaeiformis]|uniref:Uncharacterized protein n=1 Tax=Streptomyces nymphaeiformis TaxID=2663842 RepID=A0A7W7U5Y9_9ACTN|nr:hypothetical protein [Streptomyces nymphaeiformis]MBB4984210.1 hypothetical protein [Streptomyces nymphaeiformis]